MSRDCEVSIAEPKTSRGNGGLIVRLFVDSSFLSLNEHRHTPCSGSGKIGGKAGRARAKFWLGSQRRAPISGQKIARNTKLQTPSTRETPSSKHQEGSGPLAKFVRVSFLMLSVARAVPLIWSFSGVWCLVFGALGACIAVSLSHATLNCASPVTSTIAGRANDTGSLPKHVHSVHRHSRRGLPWCAPLSECGRRHAR